jgi:hypothetical protein
LFCLLGVIGLCTIFLCVGLAWLGGWDLMFVAGYAEMGYSVFVCSSLGVLF